MGDLSAVSEERDQILSTTQDHILSNLTQEPLSEIIIAPLRVENDANHNPTVENMINTEELEDVQLNCNEEIND